MKQKPLISVIVVFFNMAREAPRTLFSLTPGYQKGSNPEDYEVIAVDCGSGIPLIQDQISLYESNFRLVRTEPAPSPARAINSAAKEARGQYLTICIDGARIWSPGIMAETCAILKEKPDAVIATPAFHIGHEMQNISVSKGYSQEVEDRLLQESGWETDGYRLFQISSLDGSSQNGWFLPLQESNCITVSAKLFDKIGGYNERFSSPGGGLVNLDFFKNVCSENKLIHILASEGTFHQFHGGVSTNTPLEQHPWKIFCEEYEQLFNQSYAVPDYDPVFWGLPRAESGWMLQYSFDKVHNLLRERGNNIKALERIISEVQEVVNVLQNENAHRDNLVSEANVTIRTLAAEFEKKQNEANVTISALTAEFEKKQNEAIVTISAAMAESEKKQQTIEALNRQLADARHELYVMIQSKSWRLTRPLRMMATLIQTVSVWTKFRNNQGQ